MRAYCYPILLRAYYFLCQAFKQLQPRFSLALALSIVIHAAIIVIIGNGLSANFSGRKFTGTLQVHLINAPHSTLAESVKQTPIKSANEESAGPTVSQKPTEPVFIPLKTRYKVSELDVIPQAITPIEPEYPITVPLSVGRGVVRLELLLDENGLVTDVTVLESNPPGYFEEAAKKAFMHAKFTPGIKDGQHVKSLLNIQVQFGVDSSP